jgi:hypothetical protein
LSDEAKRAIIQKHPSRLTGRATFQLGPMNRLIAILTGLHVLAHGVFGCCEHRLDATSPPSVASPVLKTCCCHHGHQAAHPSASRANDVAERALLKRSTHPCIHSSCHWLAAAAGPSVRPPNFSVPVAVVAAPLSHGLSQHAASFRPDNVIGRTSAPPLRLHLVVGVLLV